jgi:hypothetical protein
VHGLQLLHKRLLKSCPNIHSVRLQSLIDVVESLLNSSKLTLVSLGRHLSRDIIVKNKIKQVDRLLGNEHLYLERSDIYSCLSHSLIGENSRPIILVDWSGVTHCGAFHMIRASIPMNGRTLTLYEEIYPESKKDSRKANQQFLQNLMKLLPKGCCPIIVTDAGFRNPWFKVILKLGWDFIGRVRNQTKVCEDGSNKWRICKELYKKATIKAQYIGKFLLAKNNPLACNMYIIRQKCKYRKKTNLKGHKVRCSSSLKHAKRAKEPWLIATSLASCSAKKIIHIYQLRMQIEQGFRDIKNYRNGLCLRETRSTTEQRLGILLLIAALATFVICIYGHVCQYLKLQYQYQTNSIRNRNVLSWFFLGLLKIKEKYIPPKEITHLILNEIIPAGGYYIE